MSLYGLLAQYDYDDAGRRKVLTLPNGVKVEYGYDAASRLTGLTYKLGTSVLGNLTYGYDKNGQRMKMGGSFARTTLPDPVSSATYDAANRVETFDGFSVDHDYNGNLTSLDGDTFVWNVRDQLIGIVGAGLSASFGYDGLGRRSKKTVNGQTTEVLSDGINPLQEQAVAGGPWTALTMTGLGVDEIIARGDASGVYYYLPDGLGARRWHSPMALARCIQSTPMPRLERPHAPGQSRPTPSSLRVEKVMGQDCTIIGRDTIIPSCSGS